MAKFVRGPFSTLEEVKEALQRLQQEGYNAQYITVVANREEDIHALKKETPVEVIQEDPDTLIEDDRRTFWEQLADTFSGYFFNQNYVGHNPPSADYNEDEDEDPRELLSAYSQYLDDGQIVILVEDIENKEAQFDLDAVDEEQGLGTDTDTDTVRKTEPAEPGKVTSTTDTAVTKVKPADRESTTASAGTPPDVSPSTDEEIDADPSQVMDETVPERDSHPDIQNDEDVLEQETTYVPGDAADDHSILDQHVPDIDEAAVPTDDRNLSATDVSDIQEDKLVGTPPGGPDSIPTDVTAVETDIEGTDFGTDQVTEDLIEDETTILEDDTVTPDNPDVIIIDDPEENK